MNMRDFKPDYCALESKDDILLAVTFQPIEQAITLLSGQLHPARKGFNRMVEALNEFSMKMQKSEKERNGLIYVAATWSNGISAAVIGGDALLFLKLRNLPIPDWLPLDCKQDGLTGVWHAANQIRSAYSKATSCYYPEGYSERAEADIREMLRIGR